MSNPASVLTVYSFIGFDCELVEYPIVKPSVGSKGGAFFASAGLTAIQPGLYRPVVRTKDGYTLWVGCVRFIDNGVLQSYKKSVIEVVEEVIVKVPVQETQTITTTETVVVVKPDYIDFGEGVYLTKRQVVEWYILYTGQATFTAGVYTLKATRDNGRSPYDDYFREELAAEQKKYGSKWKWGTYDQQLTNIERSAERKLREVLEKERRDRPFDNTSISLARELDRVFEGKKLTHTEQYKEDVATMKQTNIIQRTQTVTKLVEEVRTETTCVEEVEKPNAIVSVEKSIDLLGRAISSNPWQGTKARVDVKSYNKSKTTNAIVSIPVGKTELNALQASALGVHGATQGIVIVSLEQNGKGYNSHDLTKGYTLIYKLK